MAKIKRRKRIERINFYREHWGPECPNCDERASHFVPASMGEAGFYTCNAKAAAS